MNTNIAYLALMVLFLSILVYFGGGRDLKKPRGQYVNGVRLQKNIGFPIFLAKGKNLTPRQVEIPK